MSADAVYAVAGGSLLLAVVLPYVVRRVTTLSAPMVLVLVGALVGLLVDFETDVAPIDYPAFTEHLTEVTVIVALMGVGLALDRPLHLRSWTSWRSWGAAWRLLGIAMPLCIAGVAFLGWWAMGLAPAAAVLLGAVLAPTDPVLASDVQVGGPTVAHALDVDEVDETDEVRFALTSEAGLNDGLAFPFVYLAILMATLGPMSEWGLRWVGWELVGKCLVGVLVGCAMGWVFAAIAFRSRIPALRLAETGEPLLALAAVLLTYGLAELAGGYGFLAVFAGAMTLRAVERNHEYHEHMHQIIERLERLLTLAVLLLLGLAMTNGMLEYLTWQGALVGTALVFLVRPLTAWLSLTLGRHRDQVGTRMLISPERHIVAFFGVRGVGSLFYLAYATTETTFGNHEMLWATVGYTIALSVLVHGAAAKPVLTWLEERRAAARGQGSISPDRTA